MVENQSYCVVVQQPGTFRQAVLPDAALPGGLMGRRAGRMDEKQSKQTQTTRMCPKCGYGFPSCTVNPHVMGLFNKSWIWVATASISSKCSSSGHHGAFPNLHQTFMSSSPEEGM